jgi:hypothetical protein
MPIPINEAILSVQIMIPFLEQSRKSKNVAFLTSERRFFWNFSDKMRTKAKRWWPTHQKPAWLWLEFWGELQPVET